MAGRPTIEEFERAAERGRDVILRTPLVPLHGFDGDRDRAGRYPLWLKRYWKERYGQERQDEKAFRAKGNTFHCAIADYDNDGDTDCILAEITHEWAGPSSDRTALLVNDNGKFERRPFLRPHTTVGRWNQAWF